jgi:hypothetical protein
MDSEQFENLNRDLREFTDIIDSQKAKQLDLEMFNRIIKRLHSFSQECEECNIHLNDLSVHIKELKNRSAQLDDRDFKNHKTKINNIISHLQNKHHLVTEGHYLSIYMSFGMSIGLLFGMLIFDNLALGLPLGTALGIAIGSGVDADAKKKGKTL